MASLIHPKSSIVNDSGTDISILTMETAKHWNGLALKENMFQGIAGEPFSVLGVEPFGLVPFTTSSIFPNFF